jgi:hypothetical protein
MPKLGRREARRKLGRADRRQGVDVGVYAQDHSTGRLHQRALLGSDRAGCVGDHLHGAQAHEGGGWVRLHQTHERLRKGWAGGAECGPRGSTEATSLRLRNPSSKAVA